MSELSYVNFDLILRRSEAGTYTAEVISPGGRPVCPFQHSFSARDLEALRGIVGGPVRDTAPSSQGAIGTSSWNDDYGRKLRLYGEQLYDSVFTGQIARALGLSVQEAQRGDHGLRLRIHLDHAPELADLPWEYLYDKSTATYLSLSDTTPVVRYLNLATSPPSLLVKPPLNILVMTAAPRGCSRLDTDKEWSFIDEALSGLKAAKLVSVCRIPRATRTDLLEHLQDGTWHVFHFIGHGGMDRKQRPALLFEDEAGDPDPIDLEALKVVLGQTVRLAVLNSCDGARSLAGDPFSGLAQGLLRARIPAVVAMQFKITDDGAITFTRGFYNAIARSHPVDQALTRARKAMFLARNPTEWGTPVLFMCGDDGRVFQIDRPTDEQLRERQIKALSDDAKLAIDTRRYDDAIGKLQEIKKLQG